MRMQVSHRVVFLLVSAITVGGCGEEEASQDTCVDFEVSAAESLVRAHVGLVLQVVDDTRGYGYGEAYADVALAEETGLLNGDWTRGVQGCFGPRTDGIAESFFVTGTAWLTKDALPEACRDPLGEACVPGPDDPRGTSRLLVRIGERNRLTVPIVP